MTPLAPTRQAISQAIATLPTEVLSDLASFIDYLQFKTNSSQQSQISIPPDTEENSISPVQQDKKPLPRSIGMGSSGMGDLSERVDELLWQE